MWTNLPFLPFHYNCHYFSDVIFSIYFYKIRKVTLSQKTSLNDTPTFRLFTPQTTNIKMQRNFYASNYTQTTLHITYVKWSNPKNVGKSKSHKSLPHAIEVLGTNSSWKGFFFVRFNIYLKSSMWYAISFRGFLRQRIWSELSRIVLQYAFWLRLIEQTCFPQLSVVFASTASLHWKGARPLKIKWVVVVVILIIINIIITNNAVLAVVVNVFGF